MTDHDPRDVALADAPPGSTLVEGGATFRVWAPRARAVHVSGDFNGWKQDEGSLLRQIGDGHWAGFVPGVKDGDQYLFHVEGTGSSGYKRDPRARLLTTEPAFPFANCVLRDPGLFPWRVPHFVPPAFNDLVIYELHVGTYDIQPGNGDGRFFDVIRRIPYLAALGVNAVELLPIQEFPTTFSLGYNGTDLYSPEGAFAETDEGRLQQCLAMTNGVLEAAGAAPYVGVEVLRGGDNQLRALVDACHAHGICVLLDVVYNHAGGNFDEASMWFLDRMPPGDANDSLYFTDDGWAGGQVFAYWNQCVRDYLVDNARLLYREYKVDGLRFDEVSVMDRFGGWGTCQDLTAALRSQKPEAIQVAEYWPVNGWVVRDRDAGGAGFDATWHDGLRRAVRSALAVASSGRDAPVPMAAIADAVAADGLRNRWRAVQAIENHDLVYVGRDQRIAMLAGGDDARSWQARSRSRVALGLLLTAPGIPLLFMGQEILEDKPWSDTPAPATTIWWEGLESGDKAMSDFLRFTRELIAVRRGHAALRGEGCAIIHVSEADRVIAFQRWVEGAGLDVVVVCSLREDTWQDYRIGFPGAGQWAEVFNGDVYDGWINPAVSGNGGSVHAGGPPMHGLATSAALTIPANGVLIFARP